AAAPTATMSPSRSRIAPSRITPMLDSASPRRGPRPRTVTTCAAPLIRRELLMRSQHQARSLYGQFFASVSRRKNVLHPILHRSRGGVFRGPPFQGLQQPVVRRVVHFAHQGCSLPGYAHLLHSLFHDKGREPCVGELGLADSISDCRRYFIMRQVALPLQ